jgi:hypothetical protein
MCVWEHLFRKKKRKKEMEEGKVKERGGER